MDNSPPSLEDSKVLQIIGQIMISSVITLFIVITVIFFIHIYTKWHWSHSNTEDPSIVAWRRRQFALMTTGNDINGPPTTGRANQQGLDSKVLESLPVIVYNAKDGLECAVCLSEIEEGEKTRLLPSCNHRFHDGCIDMWFQSHSTCPLCRNPVMVATDGRSDSIRIQIDENLRSHDESLPSSSSSLLGGNDDGSGPHGTAGVSTQSSSFPANTQQLRGNQTQVSSLGSSTEGGQEHDVAAAATSSVSSHGNEDVIRGGSDGGKGKGSLVIDIPKRLLPTANRSSPSPMGMIASNHHDGDEMKSPAATPASTRSETLKRLLSGGKTALHSACSSTSSSSEAATSGVHHQVQQV